MDNYEHEISCPNNKGILNYLLGKLGDINDIPNLLELYLKIEDFIDSESMCRSDVFMPKRNILDAIELIYHRGKEGYDIGPS